MWRQETGLIISREDDEARPEDESTPDEIFDESIKKTTHTALAKMFNFRTAFAQHAPLL